MAEERFGDVVLGQAPRRREEAEREVPQGVAVIKAVTTVTNSNVTLWTVTDNKFLKLKDFGVCNISGANITITVYVGKVCSAAILIYSVICYLGCSGVNSCISIITVRSTRDGC